MGEKLTGDPKIDFPEIFENKIDNSDDQSSNAVLITEIQKQNEYLKRVIIDEVVDNIVVKEDKSIYDKRLKKSLFQKIYDTLFS